MSQARLPVQDRDTVWISKLSAASIHPAQVENTLRRLSETWPDAAAPSLREVVENFPLGPDALLHLIAVSSICAARLTRQPELLLWLQDRDVCAEPRGFGAMHAHLRSLGESAAANNFRALRLWKSREMLRIALREVANAAPLEETTAELSQLAEICLRQVFDHWNTELRARLGSPDAECTVLALGKLGGRELNHSSDVDLIFVYSEEGQLSPNLTYHEWFNRLTAKILETFSANDAAGPLFRVDLRLRPEGSAGLLTRSLESMENYYAGFGETWERLALIKARGVCGSRELAYEFLRQHQSFIYPKSPTPDLLEEIASIKQRIERDIVGPELLDRDVKLGVGGIREIEFITQVLQLTHGARHAFLQETSTLKVLPALAEHNLLPRVEAIALEQAYRFLRRVEHRLQIEAEQQTHTVPDSPEALRRLALSLGYDSSGAFSKNLREQMKAVRSVFERIVTAKPREIDSPSEAISIFCDSTVAAKRLLELEKGPSSFHVAPRTRQVFRKLRPLLLQALGQVADPDITLNRFVRFAEVYGLRSLLFESLATHPRLLDLLVRTLDASQPATDLLIRHPHLLEQLTRDENFNRQLSVADHLKRMRELKIDLANLDALRAYRQRQVLRILLRDLLGVADLRARFQEYSALAEACVLFLARLFGTENELTIIALGKFGGVALTYGADLDVLFVGENNRAAQQLIVAMTQTSTEGALGQMDARLRPDGEKGPLVCSLESYRSYYETRAQLWELQALSRARPISGGLQNEYLDLAQRVWRAAGRRADLFEQISAMLVRIHRDRSSGSDFHDVKTGVGGIIEAEFLVQALQMRNGIWEPRMLSAITQLQTQRHLRSGDAETLTRNYLFMRRCESVLARMENKSVVTLPATHDEEELLAKRLGFAELETFVTAYRAAREEVHQLYQRYLD